MIGKWKRINRLFHESGRIILIPMDHGVTMGPIEGLQDMKSTVRKLVDSGVDSLLLHKGMILQNFDVLQDKHTGLIMHLSGSTAISGRPTYKVTTGTVEEALAMGCDAVSLHVNIGAEQEPEMLRDMARISTECNRYGMPLLAMMYARGARVLNESDKEMVKHAARLGAELGADIVKVNYTGTAQGFHEVVEACPVPVIIAGGENIGDEYALLSMINDALQAGAKGISIGRNVFQHKRIKTLLHAVNLLVHQDASLQEAIRHYRHMESMETNSYLFPVEEHIQ